MSQHLEEPGVNLDNLKKQKELYDHFAKDQVLKGLKEPKGDGILIFDEVSVTSKVVWNSKNHKLIGLATSEEQLPTLDDVYAQFNDKDIPKAAYMLQFLWRDLTSDYDIVGPYFASENSTDSHYIAACMMETLRAFYLVGFKVSALLCDGASSNLSLIKMTQERFGAYGIKFSHENDDIDVSIKPWFDNPFSVGDSIFWCICPSHEVRTFFKLTESQRIINFFYR